MSTDATTDRCPCLGACRVCLELLLAAGCASPAPVATKAPEPLPMDLESNIPDLEYALDSKKDLVRDAVAAYTRRPGPASMPKLLARARRHKAFILSALRREGLPPELLYLPMLESEFAPRAVSRSGAAGPWQLMPKTARELGLRVCARQDERFDLAKSTRAALRHLKRLRARFGNWTLALQAYNCGESCVEAFLRRRRPLPPETQLYVPRFAALLFIGREAASSGLEPAPEPSLGAPSSR